MNSIVVCWLKRQKPGKYAYSDGDRFPVLWDNGQSRPTDDVITNQRRAFPEVNYTKTKDTPGFIINLLRKKEIELLEKEGEL